MIFPDIFYFHKVFFIFYFLKIHLDRILKILESIKTFKNNDKIKQNRLINKLTKKRKKIAGFPGLS